MSQERWYALSVWQPWATLIVRGIKNIENRQWQDAPGLQGQLRGIIERGDRLVIHAARVMSRQALELVEREFRDVQLDPGELPLGQLIGTVQPFAVTDWSPSPWYVEDHQAIHLQRAAAFVEGYRMIGRQGLFRLDDDAVAHVLGQLRAQEQAA